MTDFQKRILTIDECMQIQDRLNELTIEDWKNTLNRNHYYVAMTDEFSELLGSVPWKWWKKQGTIDHWNTKIEVIDIMHFALSVELLEKIRDVHDWSLGYDEGSMTRTPMFTPENKLNHSVFMRCFNGIYGDNIVGALDELVRSVGMSAEMCSAIYVAKATLNEIRQTKDYKKHGDAIKTIDGVEDNYQLEDIIDAFVTSPDMTLEDVRDLVEQHLG